MHNWQGHAVPRHCTYLKNPGLKSSQEKVRYSHDHRTQKKLGENEAGTELALPRPFKSRTRKIPITQHLAMEKKKISACQVFVRLNRVGGPAGLEAAPGAACASPAHAGLERAAGGAAGP